MFLFVLILLEIKKLRFNNDLTLTKLHVFLIIFISNIIYTITITTNTWELYFKKLKTSFYIHPFNSWITVAHPTVFNNEIKSLAFILYNANIIPILLIGLLLLLGLIGSITLVYNVKKN